jgi:phage shock protein C
MSGRLSRSRSDRFIGGVCGGLGKYLGIDSTVIRLIFLVLLFGNGFGFLIYIILWILLPVEGEAAPLSGSVGDRITDGMRGVGEDIRTAAQVPHPRAGLWFGAGLIVLGALLFFEQLAENLGLQWLTVWINWSTIWPVLIIVLGVALILRGTRRGE